jgi:hypothetical protein
MPQPVQHPLRVVMFDRRGELLPRAEWPAYARRYTQDGPSLEQIALEGGPLAREWEPPPCDTE